jgi:hypothetical protein
MDQFTNPLPVSSTTPPPSNAPPNTLALPNIVDRLPGDGYPSPNRDQFGRFGVSLVG